MTNICVSLETAKKLKEAGREKDTFFEWVVKNKGAHSFLRVADDWDTADMKDTYRAPTAQEILDEFEKVKERISIRWNYPNWRAYILERDYLHDFAQGRGDKLVEALADLWLACKEQGYLDALPKE